MLVVTHQTIHPGSHVSASRETTTTVVFSPPSPVDHVFRYAGVEGELPLVRLSGCGGRRIEPRGISSEKPAAVVYPSEAPVAL